MKILIVSDSHRENSNLLKVLDKVKPDALIHCGDIEGSEYVVSTAAGCPVYMVSGNNDYFSDLPQEKEVTLEGVKIWIVHGHRQRCYMGVGLLVDEAAQKGADVVCYGHTHMPSVQCESGIWAVNPGSISYPRQQNRKPSYCIMEIKKDKSVSFDIKYL
ncbi:MAG: metallophosphoesterase [Lachnospiraceae bacterium]|nr:metallophosphoesterase [Lachnospiraceae bacterium]